mgnify:CR=1 FL=1
MKNLILSFYLLFLLSCKMDFPKTELNIVSDISQVTKPEQSNQLIYGPNLPANPYELKLDTHKLSKGIYDLEIKMLLYNNAYFVSPNAKRDFSGKFTFFVDASNSFTLKDNLIEIPLSKEEYDSHPFVDGNVNWVHVNTTYKQKLEITTEEDFEVRGYIQFTIEPRCTLEKIPVFIKRKNGVLSFEIDHC